MKQSLFGRLGQKAKSWEFVLLLILILEFIIFGAKNPKFLLPNVLLGSVNDIISICIISLFVTFVMITGGIDIQVASIVGLTSIVVGVTWQDFGVNIWVACVIAIIAAALCGAISGFFVAYCGVQPMVVTLGGSFLYSGIALLISKLSATQSYKGISGFPEGFTQIASFKLFGVIPSQLLIFAGLTVEIRPQGIPDWHQPQSRGILRPQQPPDHPEHVRAFGDQCRDCGHCAYVVSGYGQERYRHDVYSADHHRGCAGRHSQHRR